MSTESLPTIPPLPDDATLDERLRVADLQMRALEYAQRERGHAVTRQLAEAQARSAAAMERTLTQGLPTDQAMVDAIVGLREAIAGAGSSRVEHLVRLLSTMTSQRRQNPATAAAAAAAELAAIEART